jgi:oligopeptide transport system substrate-binding protein
VILQREPFPKVIDVIDQETEGNPFFIEEVSKALIEQGRLVHESGLWQYREGPEGPAISQELRASIHYRVGRLPEQAQEVLRVAAMIGREFDCDVLEEVCQLGEETLIAALESAERAQFIEELPPRRGSRHRTCLGFSFVHAIVQHALEESVTGLRRQRSHARIAQALELLRREDLDELAPALARHFAGAGDWERAAECWARAGDRALSLFAYPEAIRAYRQALDVFKDRQDLEHAAKTLMKLGLIHQALSEFDEARRAFQEGSALWQLVAPIPAASLPAAPHAFRKTVGLLATLDPMHVDATWELAVAFSLFRGLVERTPEMSILPDAARAWDILEDGRRYVFHLREDVRWTDGLPTTAHDFEYAWKRCLDPHNKSPAAQLLYDIQGARARHTGEVPTSEAVGVRATDDFTLLVDLEHPVGYFLHLACSLFPVPRHVVETHGAAWADPSQIVTNGAFLVDEWRPGDRVTLVRNPAFVGRFSGNLHRVEIKMDLNLDPLACRQRYEAGENDWYCPQLPAEEDRARYMYPGEYLICPLAYTLFLLLDAGQTPFDDPRVRHAFAHALDRVTYSNVVTGGYLPPALGGLVPPGLPGHLPQTGLSHDPDRARELLAAAGYPGGRGFPDVRLAVPHSEGNTQPWQHLQGQWRTALGVNVVAEEKAIEELSERQRRAPTHMKVAAWIADYPDPDNFLRVCLDQLMGTRWHAAFHELIERARRTINQSERIALYQQADRLLIEEAVVLPLVYGRYSFFLKPWVRRFPTCPIVSDFSKDIIIEPH